MMTSYHIGTLSAADRLTLAEGYGQRESKELSPTFLEPRHWKRSTLASKKSVSWDTRIFRFKLESDTQTLGLPTGQHMMIRLRDPVTREMIIRSYTPISATSEAGFVDVLVKIYFDTPERKGGKMSQALDTLPVGHPIEFKGPIGKFEYKGSGACSVNGVERRVDKLLMVCGGSGVTPIYQVYRAVMQDQSDPTQCVVLNGNRLLEDVLCKTELDALHRENSDASEKSKLLYTLTQAPEDWEGLKGRIAAPLLEEHAHREEFCEGKAMVLICGPEPLEKSAKAALLEIGWKEEEMLFF
jgi:nitrate reductase (NAD(P)H)